jgi:hypothetical protein
MSYKNKFFDSLKFHVVDSTALLAASHPFFSAFEKIVAGMSNDVSLNTRIYITGLTYAGLGYVMGKGRDISRNLFNITNKTKEKIQQIHDSVYLASINLPLSVGLYTVAGETDIDKIVIGTGVGMGFGAFMGPWVGYAIDSYRDLTGLEKCERRAYPQVIRNLKPKTKKGLAGALTVASVGAMGLIYLMTPDLEIQKEYKQKVEVEQKITQSYLKKSELNLECLTQEFYSNK